MNTSPAPGSPPRAAQDDASLLRAVAVGDEAALRELFTRHAPWLRARLRHRCADPDVVNDALQDTFVGVWRNAGSWRGDNEPAAWLWGIAARRLVSALRSRQGLATLGAHPPAEPDPDPVQASAEDVVLLQVEHGDVGGALNRLAPELRAVMQATVLDGLTTREAAHLLGVPHGTVKTRVRAAKALLRADLAAGSAQWRTT